MNRIERSFAATRAVADALDRASLRACRPITLPLARGVLERLERPAQEPDQGEGDGSWHIRPARDRLRSEQGAGARLREALAENGVELVVNARGSDALEATAAEIRARCGVPVAAVAADITTREGRAAVLAACPEPDILVNNAGGPPPGDFRDWDEQA